MSKTGALLLMVILCLGSAASAQWIVQESNLPADVHAYRICAVNENVVWAAGIKSFRAPCMSFSHTVDGGEHWQAGMISVPQDSTLFILNISACDADTAWAAVGSFHLSDYAGIYSTVDGGINWVRQPSAFPFPNQGPAFVHFFNSREGLTASFGTYDGYIVMYTTSNGGIIWEPIVEANRIYIENNRSIDLLSNFSLCGNDFYTTVLGKMLVTRDKGKSWQQSTFTTSYGWPGFINMHDGIISVFLYMGSSGFMTYPMMITADGGLTWQTMTPPDISVFYASPMPGTASCYLVSGGLWGVTRPGSAFTLDNGQTWTMIDRIAHLCTEMVNRNLGWGGDGSSSKIFKWYIGPQAAIGRYPLTDLVFPLTKVGGHSLSQSVTITNYGQAPLVISEIIPGANSGFSLSYDLPKTINSLESAPVELFFAPKTSGIVSDSVVIVSSAANSPRYSLKLSGQAMSITPAQAGLLYAVSATSLYTIDPVSAKATLIGPTPLTNLHGLTIDPATRELTASSTLNTSSSYYAVQSNSAASILLQTVPVGNIRALAFKADTLFGATPTGKLYCLDLDKAEATLLGAAPGVYYHSITVHPATGILYGSMQASSGPVKDLIVTINSANGDTTLIGATGDGQATPAIAFSPSGILYGLKGTGTTLNTLITIDPSTGAATTVGSTEMSGLRALAWAPATTAVDEPAASDVQPQEFVLLQNYPNPFNAKTVISFTIPRTEHVNITLFDILGREIAVLANGPYTKGMHKITWEANSFSSGIYFYRMTAGTFSQMRKLAILE